MITPIQSRMARAALGWSLQDLAREADLGIATISRFEIGKASTNRTTLSRLRRTFETAGLDFIEQNGGGPGVRLRERLPEPDLLSSQEART